MLFRSKKAKVTTGAVSFPRMFEEIVTGTVDKVKVQPFLDKINLPYNTLVFMDDSGSMSWGQGRSGFNFLPCEFAAFIATICMMKNPDPSASNLMGLFAGDTRMINNVSKYNDAPNSLMRGQTRTIATKPLIDEKAHFLDNLANMRQWLRAACTNGYTDVSSIPEGINVWVNGDPQKIEELQRYPIWTLISDGNFNNLGNASSSMNDFMRKCQNYFGFKPYIIVIDVARGSSQKIQTFSGIDNLMMIPPNPTAVEMFLTNFRDMDTFDVYTPIQSMYRSNRYAPVRDLIYATEKVKTAEAEPVTT